MKVLDFGMEGKTEQETTTGKNLCNLQIGKRFNTSGEIIDKTDYAMCIIDTTTELDVVISVPSTAEHGAYLCDMYYNGEYTHPYTRLKPSSSTTFTLPEGRTMLAFSALDADGNNIDEYTDTNVQIELGSTATTYEPYTNGPSPNPDYPQEITNAGVHNEATGRYEIGCMISGQNIFDLEKAEIVSSKIFDDNTGEVKYYGTTGYAVLNYWTIIPGITYTVSATKNASSTSGMMEACLYDSDKKFTRKVGWKSEVFSFTANENERYIRVWYQNNDVNTLQIEPSSVQTEFENFKGSRFITLTSDRPLTKWDYLTKRDGVWGWSVNSVHDLLSSSSSIGWLEYGNSNGVYVYKINLDIKAIGWQTSMCTSFRNINGAHNKYELWTYSDQPALKIMYFCTNFTTLEEWKAYLDENPLDIWYQTAEEQTFYSLPDSEQELMNNLATYYGVTNIYNDQNCPMQLTYVLDTKTYIKNEVKNAVAELQALILEN